MADRVETEHQVLVGDKPGRLYASSGLRDDYIEIVLPAALAGEAKVTERFSRLGEDPSGAHLDIRIRDGEPTIVSILALYVGEKDVAGQPYAERIAGIFEKLARAVPVLDFGDLIPETTTEAAPSPPPVECVALPASEPAVERLAQAVPTGNEARWHPDDAIAGLAPAAHRFANADRLRDARRLAARGHVHKALRAVEDVLRADPDDGEAQVLQEHLQLLARRVKRREREPKNAQAHLEAGFSYLTLECDREAINALREAIRLAPGLYLAHLLLGIALHRDGEVAAASQAYERARLLRPRDEMPGSLLAALQRGEPPPLLVEDPPKRSPEHPLAHATPRRLPQPTAPRGA